MGITAGMDTVSVHLLHAVASARAGLGRRHTAGDAVSLPEAERTLSGTIWTCWATDGTWSQVLWDGF